MKASQLLLAAILAGVVGTVVQLRGEGDLPPLDGATAWINSPRLTPAGLRGKVVVVNFWTYSCINWLRQLPHVRAWAEKYKDQGLVVIGVHTPEFSFETDLDNVRRAAKDMKVDYPVAVDTNRAVWTAFGNQYWPALYFVDAQGRIRHHQFGEGKYEESEKVIQQLLTEAGARGAADRQVPVDARGIEAAADWGSLRSPENYVGSTRTQSFGSPGGAVVGKPHAYAVPARMRLNEWALAGDWTMERESAMVNKAGGRIAYRFHARDLHLVLTRAAHGRPVRFRITIDGAPPGSHHGVDVDADGWGTVSEDRLYQLVRQAGPIVDRTFEIEFSDAGPRAFAFTFG